MIKQTKFAVYEGKNQDPYGACCVNVAREVMRNLELLPDSVPISGKNSAFHFILNADKKIGAGGITGFMAGCVAGMVYKCHSRGNEFKKSYEAFQ